MYYKKRCASSKTIILEAMCHMIQKPISDNHHQKKEAKMKRNLVLIICLSMAIMLAFAGSAWAADSSVEKIKKEENFWQVLNMARYLLGLLIRAELLWDSMWT